MSTTSGLKKDDFAAMGTAQTQAGNAYNALQPTYAQMMTGTDGMTPQQKADALTAAAQSNGGSTAGIVGQGALMSARTGNVGSYAAIADAASRTADAQQSTDALSVQQQSDALAHQNQMAAIQGEQGVYNDANSTGSTYANLTNQVAPTFWQNLASGATSAALGIGMGAAGKTSWGCWLAESLYGADDPRTHTVRAYLNGAFRRTRFGDVVMRAYLRYGERAAKVVAKSSVLRAIIRPFFDRALSSALGETERNRRALQSAWQSLRSEPTQGAV